MKEDKEMNKQEYINTAEQELLHTYNRFSLVLDHGEGVHLYDTDGKEYLDLCHKACESGELPPSINIVRLYATGKKGERMVNATQQNKVDPLSPEQLFPAEYALREQIVSVVRFLKKNIPGFENIRVNGSAVTAGIRESRRIIGRNSLKKDCCPDITLDREYLILGKSRSQADVVLPGDTVSRKHARIERRMDGYYVTDLFSTNGTFLDGHRLESGQAAALKNGARLTIASLPYRFVTEE